MRAMKPVSPSMQLCLGAAGWLVFTAAAQANDITADRPDEAIAIAASGGKAARRGLFLDLSTSACPVEFQDGRCPVPGQTGCRYVFVKRVDGKALLVKALADEAYAYFWVNEADGQIVQLRDEALSSPDGRYFAVVSTCDGYGGCILQIWASEGPKRIFQYEPTGYADFRFRSWSGNDRVLLDIGTWAGGQLQYSPAEMRQVKPTLWRLNP